MRGGRSTPVMDAGQNLLCHGDYPTITTSPVSCGSCQAGFVTVLPQIPTPAARGEANCAYSPACSPCWALNKPASVPGLESCHQHRGLQQCSTLVFLLFHPSQEELLVSMPGLVLVLALLWLLSSERGFPGRTGAQPGFYFMAKTERLWPGPAQCSDEWLGPEMSVTTSLWLCCTQRAQGQSWQC